MLGHFRIARTKPNTIWRLGQFAVDRDTVIELDQGKIFVFDEGFREDRPTVDVVTPAGIASARGTWMSVAFDPDTGVADIQCFRGICELANDRGSVVLTDEQKSTMTAQSAPIEPQAMGEPDLLEFTQLPEAESGEVAIPAPRVPALSQASTRSTTPLPTPTPSDTPTPLITLAPADMPTSTPIPPVTEAPTSTPIPPATEAPTFTPLPVSTPTAPSTPAASGEEALRWTASADGSWHDPANWSSGAVPGPSDNVVVDVPGNVTITHSQGSTPISRLVLARGTLSVDSTIQISNGFSQSGGTLTGSSGLVVGGLFTWTGGIMEGTGTTTADGGMNINGTGTMSLRRTLVNAAGQTATWTNGNVGFFGTATFDNQGTFLAEHAGNRSLLNQGGAGVKAFENAGSFIKAAPVSGTVATTTVGSPIVFNNTGLVEVQAGTLKLDGEIIGGGDYTVAAEATLDLSPARATTLGSTADITGAGVVHFSGATVTINGIYNITGETQFAGGVTFNAFATLTSLSGGPVAISAGTVTFDSGETPINVTTFDLTGGTLAGSDDVAASGLFTWTGGIMEGTGATTADGGMNINGTGTMSLRRTLVNAAGQTATWTNGNIGFFGTATFNNQGTFLAEHAGNRSLLNQGGAGVKTFENAGSFIKAAPVSGTVATTTVGSPIVFNNTGLVEVQAGTLKLDGEITGGGDYTVAAEATLDLSPARATTLGSTADITGAGTVHFSGATVDINGIYNITGETQFAGSVTFNAFATLTSLSGGPVAISAGTVTFDSGETPINVTTLDLTGGTLAGSDDVAASGLFTWTGGIMEGTGATTADGGMNINGTGTMSLRRTLVNAAGQTATWTNGNVGFFGTATFDNQGTFLAEHAGNRSLLNQGGAGVKAFENAGSFIKAAPVSGTVATTTVGSPIVFNNTGLVEVQAGTLKLDGEIIGGGDYTVAAEATLDLSPARATTLGSTADITGAGVVHFSGATVTINGIYNITGETQFAGGVTFNAMATLTSLSGGPVVISSGTVTFDSGETPINVTTFDLTGGTLAGSDDVAASGLFTWTGGIMEGTGATTADGGMNINGTGTMSLRRTLVNAAGQTATWTNGNIGFFGTATFDNQGTFRAEHAGNRSLVNQGGAGVKAFENAGSFIKAAPVSGTVATTTVGSPIVFNNTGLVEVQAGTLKLDGEITGGGDYRVAAGANLLD